MNQRDTLGEQADFYRDLHDEYVKRSKEEQDIIRAENTRIKESIARMSFKQGRQYEREHTRAVEWRKLITIVVSGSFVGCSLALAVAIWLSTL